MPISLGYAQTRALAKRFRELTGKDIQHTAVLEAISAVVGMPMDGMMHMLKSEERAAAANTGPAPIWGKWAVGEPTLDIFDRMPKDPQFPLPAFGDALPFIEHLIRTAPRRVDYYLVFVRIDNLAEFAEEHQKILLGELTAKLREYVAENNTMAACVGSNEFVVLVKDVDIMNEDDWTMGWFAKKLVFGAGSHGDEDVWYTAAVSDTVNNVAGADLMIDEAIAASRESIIEGDQWRPRLLFVWGPSGF
jgi:hypothetical protein